MEHYADDLQVPDTQCVLARLQSVATGNAVRQMEDRIHLGTNHRFLLDVQAVTLHVGVLVRQDDSASLRLTASAPKHSIGELQRARRSIGEVEHALAGHCGLVWETMEESCEGEHCEAFLAMPGGNAASSSVMSYDPTTDRWLGQWNGPEGTFLRLEGGKGRYEITVQNLDGPRTYQGIAVGAQIQFDRNGEKESIRATSGAETGMKWLSEKSDCLTVRPGEGYCRD